MTTRTSLFSFIPPTPLRLSQERWESEPIAVIPPQWHRLRFRVRAAGVAYWAAVFHDQQGAELPDHYDSIDASADWREVDGYFRAKDGAETARIRFQPIRGQLLEVAEVEVATASHAEVLAFADRCYATLPPITFTPESDRRQQLPETRQKLAAGQCVRCVTLGDSIMNDVQNSTWEVLVGRASAPGAIQVYSAVCGSKGCRYYLDPALFSGQIVARQPELVMICAMSGRTDYGSVRALLEKLRAESGAEVLLTTNPFAPDGDPRTLSHGMPASDLDAKLAETYANIARQAHAGFLDLYSAWRSYIGASELPYSHFMRDTHHANSRGREVVARMLAKYFQG